MKLRKIVALILALAMAVSMVACSKDPEKTPAADTQKETSSDVQTDNTEEDVQQPAADAEAGTEADADAEAGVQQEQAPISLEDEDKNDKVGYVSGSTYRNPYFNLTFTAPENATYYDAQGLLAMGNVSNLPADTEAAFAAQMEQGGAYVMMVLDLNGAGANILVKKTPDAYKGISEEELYLMAKTELDVQMQANNLGGEIVLGSTTFMGESRAVLHATMDNANMMQKQLYLVQDDYTCIITASASDADTLDSIMALFT